MQHTDEYVRIREGYLEERVYLHLARALTYAGYSDAAGRALVAEAFAEARRDWEAAEGGGGGE